MKLAHSYSSIKMYENCPQRYYRQRVLKDVKDEGGTASWAGERIHKALEHRLAQNTELDQEVAKYEPLCTRLIDLAEPGELMVEHELVLTEELTPTTWWAEDAWLRSKLDVFILLPGGLAVIADWKTGKRRPDSFQMMLFAAQVFKQYPQITRVRTMLLWLQDMATDAELYRRRREPEMWADILARTNHIARSLRNDEWPAKPSGLCAYCPARFTCPWALHR